MYSVVIAADWCSVVPQSWVNSENKTCLWPPNTANITKAVQKQLHPETSWKSTTVKYILGPYSKYIYIYIYNSMYNIFRYFYIY